jgi:3-hydroxyacyl-CoA dehydrogenase
MDEKTRKEVSFTAKKMHDEAGLLGKKGGKGFYLYDPKTGKKSSVNSSVDSLIERGNQNKIPLKIIQNRLLFSLLNEAALTLSEGIISNPKDGDIGAIFGMGFPPFEGGPFRMLDKNLELILTQMEELVDQYGERFKPVDFLKEHQKTTKYFYKS